MFFLRQKLNLFVLSFWQPIKSREVNKEAIVVAIKKELLGITIILIRSYVGLKENSLRGDLKIFGSFDAYERFDD